MKILTKTRRIIENDSSNGLPLPLLHCFFRLPQLQLRPYGSIAATTETPAAPAEVKRSGLLASIPQSYEVNVLIPCQPKQHAITCAQEWLEKQSPSDALPLIDMDAPWPNSLLMDRMSNSSLSLVAMQRSIGSMPTNALGLNERL